MKLRMKMPALFVVFRLLALQWQIIAVKPFSEIALIVLPRHRDGETAGALVDGFLQALFPHPVRANRFADLLMYRHRNLLLENGWTFRASNSTRR